MAVDYKFSSNYYLGRGKVGISEDLLSFYDVGNTPAFNYTITVNTIEHKTSRERLKQTDKEATLDITAEGSINFDTVHPENMRMFLLGDTIEEQVQSAAATQSNDLYVAKLGHWKNIADDDTGLGNFVPDENISNVVVKDDADAITYIEGVHYRLDKRAGLIMPITTTAANPIAEDDVLHIDYDKGAVNKKKIGAAKIPSLSRYARFFGNPATGSIIDVVAKANITPDGTMDLVGDDFANATLKLKFLSDDNIDGLLEHYDYGEVA